MRVSRLCAFGFFLVGIWFLLEGVIQGVFLLPTPYDTWTQELTALEHLQRWMTPALLFLTGLVFTLAREPLTRFLCGPEDSVESLPQAEDMLSVFLMGLGAFVLAHRLPAFFDDLSGWLGREEAWRTSDRINLIGHVAVLSLGSLFLTGTRRVRRFLAWARPMSDGGAPAEDSEAL